MSHQSSCPDSWVSTKNSNDLTFAWTSKKMPLTTPAFFRMSLRVTKPGSPRPKKARQVRSNIKSMLIWFFDQKGIVHREFVPSGQTVNAAFCIEVLKHLGENVRRKRPDQWRKNTWQPMVPSWLDGFWPITTWLWCHILPTCTQRLFLISKTENEA